MGPKKPVIPRITTEGGSQERRQMLWHSSHKSLNCPNVVGPEERRKVLRNKRLCFNCTDSHFTSNFKSKVSCEFCHLKHHSSIHSPAAKKSGRSEKLKVKLAIKNAEIAYYNKQVTENKNHSASISENYSTGATAESGTFCPLHQGHGCAGGRI